MDAEDLVKMVRDLFTTMPSGRNVRFLAAHVREGELEVTFAGHPGDSGGPYGLKVRIPPTDDDPAWSEYMASTRTEWVEHAVVLAAVEAYDTRSFASADPDSPVTWLLP